MTRSDWITVGCTLLAIMIADIFGGHRWALVCGVLGMGALIRARLMRPVRPLNEVMRPDLIGSSQPSTLSLNCQLISPPIPFPANSIINALELSENASGFAEHISSGTEPDGFWPSRNSTAEHIYRCQLVNDGNSPIFAAILLFYVEFREVLEAKNNAKISGRTTFSHSREVTIPRVEAHGGTFTFYIRNRSSQFANVRAPDDITFEPAMGGRRSHVLLRRSVPDGPVWLGFDP